MLRLSRPGRGFPSGPALFLTDYYIALPMAEPMVSAVSRRIRWVAWGEVSRVNPAEWWRSYRTAPAVKAYTSVPAAK